jgi:hypothetical protein
LAVVVDIPADVIGMTMGDHDDIDLGRIDPLMPHVLEQLADRWSQGSGARIDEHRMVAGPDEQAAVWGSDGFGVVSVECDRPFGISNGTIGNVLRRLS